MNLMTKKIKITVIIKIKTNELGIIDYKPF